MILSPIIRRSIIAAGIGLLLLVPLIAMQFSAEVNWTLSDFLIATLLLAGLGLAVDFILGWVKTTPRRITLVLVAIVVFLLIWAELAVGVFGSPFAGS